MRKTPIWQMIQRAVTQKDGASSYSEIKTYIKENWGPINELTINCQCNALSVNKPSRVNFRENRDCRRTDEGSRYDILFAEGRGKVTLYDPLIHGVWEIYIDNDGCRKIRQLRPSTDI